jgi:ligand-binding sensor domain-containing protein
MWIVGSSGLVECDLDGDVVQTTSETLALMAIDPEDGSLWGQTYGGIVHVALDGTRTRYSFPGDLSVAVGGLTFGSDGALWLITNTRLIRVTRAGELTGEPLSISGGQSDRRRSDRKRVACRV